MAKRTQREHREEAIEKELSSAKLKRELTILERWGIDAEYLTKVVSENPSLRGMIVGYIAERKLRELFEKDDRVQAIRKDDDHDREKKGDLVVTYKGSEFRIEVKSLQTNTIKMVNAAGDLVPMMKRIRSGQTAGGKAKYRYILNPEFDQTSHDERLKGRYVGAFQCDASDRRPVETPGGAVVETTCLLVGEFDILATGLFGFREKWDFGFALNRDLPTASKKYPDGVREYLLATSMNVTWPLSKPFVADPFMLMDQLAEEQRRKKF